MYCDIQNNCKLLQQNQKLLNSATAQYNLVVEQNKNLQQDLMPFRDKYFANLSMSVIAELAKKSIRLTDENMKYYHFFEDIQEMAKKIKENSCFGMNCGFVDEILKITEQVIIKGD